MMAYSYAAQYPGEVEKLALLEAPIPGVGDIWEKVYTTPAPAIFTSLTVRLHSNWSRDANGSSWNISGKHFRWTQKTFSEADRQIYAKAYAQEGAMRAAFEMFESFESQDADNGQFAVTRLPMPVLTRWKFKRKLEKHRTLANGTATDGNESRAEEVSCQLIFRERTVPSEDT
jgi:pimeloyl-ACP methyl ester carboxylesterase